MTVLSHGSARVGLFNSMGLRGSFHQGMQHKAEKQARKSLIINLNINQKEENNS